ncbi:MAG TPA: creatininase family protein [Firmicutes bacterium]|nr:creatininase family protein [Candidatus Fermentithermobacillaceae bacterium]
MNQKKLLYEKLTWPEVAQAAREGKFILVPAGMIEDHGPHLPVDTDTIIARAICERTAEKMNGEALVAPAIVTGYSPHHMDTAGPLSISWDTFIKHTQDILESFIHHGFRYILVVNGHGSNAPCLEMACRLAMVNNDHARVAFTSWWQMSSVVALGKEIRESEVMSHGCEAETSMYLAIAEEYVDMSKAPRDISHPIQPHFFTDLLGEPLHPHKNRVSMVEYWSTMTSTGIVGDATVASKEKGLKLLEAVSSELCEVLREMKERPWRPRVDRHR